MTDVLNLSCVTLEQNINDNKNEEGPLWAYFWNSIYQPGDQMNIAEASISPHASNFLLQLNTDVLPEDSASIRVSNNSSSSKRKKMKRNREDGYHNSLSDYSETPFTFKFTSHTHKTYRILCRPKITDVLDAIRSKVKGGGDLDIVSYLDDEQDQVFISADTDLEDAVDQAIKTGQTCVKLVVRNHHHQNHIPLNTSQSVKKRTEKKLSSSSLLLPGAISFLGITVAVVFICSRVSKQ